jgi:hypothetical protein
LSSAASCAQGCLLQQARVALHVLPHLLTTLPLRSLQQQPQVAAQQLLEAAAADQAVGGTSGAGLRRHARS